jgi:hypothetical protein
MTNPNLQTVLQRLECLERANRRWRTIGTMLVAVALCSSLIAWMAQDPQPGAKKPRLEADCFALVDDQGKTRAEFKLQADGSPGLFLHNSEGKTRIKVAINKDQESLLILADHEGNTRLGMASDSSGVPHLILSDKFQKPRAHMAVSQRGAPGLLFIHEDGEMPAGIGIHADGKPWLRPEADKQEAKDAGGKKEDDDKKEAEGKGDKDG